MSVVVGFTAYVCCGWLLRLMLGLVSLCLSLVVGAVGDVVYDVCVGVVCVVVGHDADVVDRVLELALGGLSKC